MCWIAWCGAALPTLLISTWARITGTPSISLIPRSCWARDWCCSNSFAIGGNRAGKALRDASGALADRAGDNLQLRSAGGRGRFTRLVLRAGAGAACWSEPRSSLEFGHLHGACRVGRREALAGADRVELLLGAPARDFFAGLGAIRRHFFRRHSGRHCV